LNHSTFLSLPLDGIRILDCQSQDVDYREASLVGADLRGSDFSDSFFIHTDLTRADLRRASNYHISPKTNELRGAKFTLPEAMALLYAMEIEVEDLEG
jgi:uncharacterized protein YjbI with pentapeptide repeats